MIAYFDTSAIVPLVLRESTTMEATDLWRAADRVSTSWLSYPEGRSALAMAERAGRVTPESIARSVQSLDALFEHLDVGDIDEPLSRWAGDLALAHALSGADALHLAAAEAVGGLDALLVSGDRRLCRAARRHGLAVAELGA